MARKKSRPAPPEAANLEEANQLIKSLWDRLNDLEDRLNQNSRNSSRPPSSDGPGAPSRQRQPSGRKRGAQDGHKGSKRMLVDDVDETHRHLPPSHCSCGGRVSINATPYRRHQVFDIPEQAYSVVEHQLYAGRCRHCDEAHQAELPDTVPSGQMGVNLLAYVAVQSGQFHQSISQIQQQLIQNFGLSFSRGAISEAQGRVSPMLTPGYQAIKHALLSSDIVHADDQFIGNELGLL